MYDNVFDDVVTFTTEIGSFCESTSPNYEIALNQDVNAADVTKLLIDLSTTPARLRSPKKESNVILNIKFNEVNSFFKSV